MLIVLWRRRSLSSWTSSSLISYPSSLVLSQTVSTAICTLDNHCRQLYPARQLFHSALSGTSILGRRGVCGDKFLSVSPLKRPQHFSQSWLGSMLDNRNVMLVDVRILRKILSLKKSKQLLWLGWKKLGSRVDFMLEREVNFRDLCFKGILIEISKFISK